MASKTEYYDRIISSLQSDITSQKSEISDLKSTVARQQKEIEALKASQGVPQKSMKPQQKWITTENLLLAVKRVCDDVIWTNNERLPIIFVDRQEFEAFRKSVERKFLAVEPFASYKKSLETRLKSIEEKLTHRYALLTINRHDKNDNSESKSYFNLNSIIRAFKNGNLQWLKPIIVCLSIGLLALHLLHSITP
ncbi:MAG: hypothetical protein HDT00_08145 [Bacteroidales bacterium]|nr:hypothetical protein [Bacteroidales bacterium]